MNRRKFLSYMGCGCCGFVMNSCTSAPITERKQLKIIPESKLNAQAAAIYEKIKRGLKLTALFLFIGISVWQGYSGEREYGDKRAKPPLYGIWEVETMHINDSLVAPLLTNEQRWRYLVIDYKDRCSVMYMDDEVKWLNLEIRLGSKIAATCSRRYRFYWAPFVAFSCKEKLGSN